MSKPSPARMIVLFTDFGGGGPYVGQMQAVLAAQAPGAPRIDLLHEAPRFNPRAAAHLLAACLPAFPEDCVLLGVVDPGVGDARRAPIAVQVGGRWCVGPDNGLFEVFAARACAAGERVSCWEITWRPANLSNSFHGRDLFAPVAARLARGEAPPGEPRDWRLPADTDLAEVIFIDHYGNAVTGLRASGLATDAGLQVGDQRLPRVRTFSSVAVGQAFCYENANGLLEIAVNQGSAVAQLGLAIGQPVTVC